MKRIFSFIEKHEALIVILCAVALMRLPGLFEPNRYADEDIYLTIGQALRRGFLLYRDIYDNKTPLIYLIAAIAGSVMWFRLILMIWNLVNIVLISLLSKKLQLGKWGVTLATVLFAVFTTLPLLEGEIANGEIFMIMPVTAAIYLILTKTGQPRLSKMTYLWAGMLWSTAFLFKTPPAIELFGLIFFLTVYQAESLSDFGKKVFDKRVWLLGFGFVVPIVVTVIYFYLSGAGAIYLQSALLQNFSYLSSWGGGGGGTTIFSGGLTTRGLILILTLAMIFVLRKRLSNEFGLVSIWSATAIFSAFLSGRPYPHYLLEVVGPMALLVTMVLIQPSRYRVFLGVTVSGLLLLGVIRYRFWYYKSLPYYQNFVSYIFGRKTREQFYAYWGDNVLRDYEVGAYVNKSTDKNDRIFVWGTEPAIYAITNRLPAVKYTVAYHILDFAAQEEVGRDLMRENPKVIMVVKSEKGKFTELAGILEGKYAFATTVGNVAVYLRLK